ncbi:MAG: aminotransferase class IV [Actinomycetota bacterium]
MTGSPLGGGVIARRRPSGPPTLAELLERGYSRSPPEGRPHIKHFDGSGQAYYGRLVRDEGFDEALLVGPDGTVAEGSVTNIAFADGDKVVWPDEPALRGISMQVLERELDHAGIPRACRAVNVADVGSFDGAFVTDPRGIAPGGIAPVGRIDETGLPTDADLVSAAVRLFEAAPWDPI